MASSKERAFSVECMTSQRSNRFLESPRASLGELSNGGRVFGGFRPVISKLSKFIQSLFIAIFAIMNLLNGLKHEKGQNKNKNFRHSTTLIVRQR